MSLKIFAWGWHTITSAHNPCLPLYLDPHGGSPISVSEKEVFLQVKVNKICQYSLQLANNSFQHGVIH